MTNTNDMREAFKDFRDQRNKELAANGLDDQSKFWITNAHYTAWCSGSAWQSQQAQGDPVAFARMLGGEVDWDENCLFPDAETGISDLDGRGDSDEYEIVPLYRHPPVLANMPEQGEHTKPVADAVKHLNDWLSMGLCGCEGPGHSCGATKIRNTIEGLEKLLNAPPAPAAVPEGQAIRLLARVQGWWQNTDGDMPASLEQDIANLLTASPTPGHIADVRKMVAPDVSELEKAAQTLWRESYSCESDFIQAVVDAFSKQLEEAERDRDSFADGLLLADFYTECPECGENIDNGPHHPDCKYTDVIARARSIVDRQQPQGGEDE